MTEDTVGKEFEKAGGETPHDAPSAPAHGEASPDAEARARQAAAADTSGGHGDATESHDAHNDSGGRDGEASGGEFGQEFQGLEPEKNADGKAVATTEQNDALHHVMGGATTRDSANDLGVPMLPGSPDEPTGPEDALGEGPTRGDYRERIGPPGYNPHETKVDAEGRVVVEAQRARAEDIGDVPGKKGGVDTATPAPAQTAEPRTA